MTIYFYGSNREIVAENVKKCYSMIQKYGFNKAMGAKNGADCYSKNGDAVTVLTWQS